MKIEKFEDILPWQKARTLTKEIYSAFMDYLRNSDLRGEKFRKPKHD